MSRAVRDEDKGDLIARLCCVPLPPYSMIVLQSDTVRRYLFIHYIQNHDCDHDSENMWCMKPKDDCIKSTYAIVKYELDEI
jgi:hypothetical protein